jgi:predicted flap endonuclease-1-like 5' DNA nuclease
VVELVKEVPVEVIKVVEKVKTVEVIKEVPVEVIKEVVKEVKVVKEVPVEVIKEITLIREVEVVKIVEKPVVKIKEIIRTVEVIKEVPVEIIKEVEVVKQIDFNSLKKMMAKMGTVEVSKKVVGTTRSRKEGTVVSRKEIKAGEETMVTGKATKIKSTKTKSKSKAKAKPAAKKSASKTKATTKKTTAKKAAPKKKATPKKAKKDDLKKVEGIGPAIEKLLYAAKITTWKKLSTTSTAAIKKILDKAGPRFKMHDPKTWPKQSGMAAKRDWAKLTKWQDELDGEK